MRPLTDITPKPLLKAGQHRLIEYHLLRLAAAGVDDIVINIAYKGAQIRETLGDGRRYGARIQYSDEGQQALETGGGIRKALSLLNNESFIVINSDIWTDYPVENLLQRQLQGLAHLILVKNPQHNSTGDFALLGDRVNNEGTKRLTFSGIGLYSPALFADVEEHGFPLAPLLRQAADQQLVSGEYYEGQWLDIGTPERLEYLSTLITQRD